MIKKIINKKENIVKETIEGFVNAYKNLVEKDEKANVIFRKEKKKQGNIGLIIGNGAGHEPACIGFVGKNMLDANAYGGLFAAPGPDHIYEAIRHADRGNGVCVLISNHAGDVLNGRMAIDMAEDDNIRVKEVILYDDVASAKKEEIQERRGTAGTFFVYKIVGSFAEESSNLDEVVEIAEKVRDNTRTLTVALTPGSSPLTENKMFEIADDEIEMGIGVHGEASANTMKMGTAEEIAKIMCSRIIKDKPYEKNDEVIVLVNGCGQTTQMELFIFYNEVQKYLKNCGIISYKPAIGNFITTQEMGGISLALCKVDKEMKKLWSKETTAPGFPKLG